MRGQGPDSPQATWLFGPAVIANSDGLVRRVFNVVQSPWLPGSALKTSAVQGHGRLQAPADQLLVAVGEQSESSRRSTSRRPVAWHRVTWRSSPPTKRRCQNASVLGCWRHVLRFFGRHEGVCAGVSAKGRQEFQDTVLTKRR